MIQKPEIQYIGQFYVYGSEARAEELKVKKTKSLLPKPKLEKLQKIYIDPVALGGITVAVVMLVVLAIGAFQLRACWQQYNTMSAHLSEVKRQNAMLEHAYRTGFDLEDVKQKALSLGMIPASEAETRTVRVTMPQPKAEPTMWDDIVWFFDGLFD